MSVIEQFPNDYNDAMRVIKYAPASSLQYEYDVSFLINPSICELVVSRNIRDPCEIVSLAMNYMCSREKKLIAPFTGFAVLFQDSMTVSSDTVVISELSEAEKAEFLKINNFDYGQYLTRR